MILQPNWVYDGSLSFEGGMDGGRPAVTLPENQLHRAVNLSVRGGWPTPRPKISKVVTLDAPGRYQGGSGYLASDGNGWLLLMVGGKLHKVSVAGGTSVLVTLPDAGNNPKFRKAWFCQAEEYLIVQDGWSRALIWDGNTARRAADDEVPIGTATAYGIGRLWVAKGREYYGGDLVYSHPLLGTASVLKFTENVFLNEGGGFSVPWQSGGITGLSFTARQDTATGEGGLMVFTRNGIFEFIAPVDREVWKNLEQPLQRFAQLRQGGTSHESIVQVNGDLFFRSTDGARSFFFADRDFSQWGNTPMSREVEPVIGLDDPALLGWASAINFDNRFIMTAEPLMTNLDTIHRGLVVIDFDLISGMRGKLPPAWEGQWLPGWQILQLFDVEHQGRRRAFLAVRDEAGTISIWEIGVDRSQEPVEWEFRTKGYQFALPKERKRLETAQLWFDDVRGPVSVQVWYRSDARNCWVPWAKWRGSGPDCMEFLECMMPQPVAPALLNPLTLPVAPMGMPVVQREGIEFQLRVRVSGHATLRKLVMIASRISEMVRADEAPECESLDQVSCEPCPPDAC